VLLLRILVTKDTGHTMKKKLLIIALMGFVLNGCSLLHVEERQTMAIYARANAAVVCIHAEEQEPDAFGEIATGTGFLWDAQGHIVTTQHLVSGYKSLTVNFEDQGTREADVVSSDNEYDLAVLKLRDTSNLPAPARTQSSKDLKIGQHVYSISNAFDLGRSFTSGIISALGRNFGDPQTGGISNLIQTDAAINPGSSGAPLLDSSGRVIGVNVAIYSLSGGSDGIGFAVPMDVVRQVVPRLISAPNVL